MKIHRICCYYYFLGLLFLTFAKSSALRILIEKKWAKKNHCIKSSTQHKEDIESLPFINCATRTDVSNNS